MIIIEYNHLDNFDLNNIYIFTESRLRCIMGPHVDKILVLHEGRIEEGMFIHILICKVILITVSY